MSQTAVSLTIVGITFAIYVIIAIWSRVSETSGFYVAGRSIPAFWNGQAIAADWMSAASFISMAGNVMALGYDGLAYIMGWTGGYVLLALFLAPQLRKFGKYTVPDFVGDRYESQTARVVAAICAMVVSFTYVIAQMNGSGIVVSRLANVHYSVGIFLAIAVVAFYAVLGGMKGITWTQVAQYLVLITAYLIPVILMSAYITGVPFPWAKYGTVLQKVTEMEIANGIRKLTIQPFNDGNAANFLALTFVLMVGTAGLPHIIVRFYTVPTIKAARWSAAWALLFICLLYLSAPAYAAFARYNLLSLVGTRYDQLPAWVASWSKVGLLKFADANGDGILQWAEMNIHNDIVVLATPEIAGLGKIVVGLIAAGGLAAALSTAGGLLLAISSSFAHDIYYRILNPQADEAKRVLVGRVAILVATVVAGLVAMKPPGLIVQVVSWAFSLAASSFFPVLVLGVWWKRANKNGAVAGMIAGLAVALTYIIAARWGGFSILGIKDQAGGIFGMTVNFLVTWLVSRATAEPSRQMQEEVVYLRLPEEVELSLMAK